MSDIEVVCLNCGRRTSVSRSQLRCERYLCPSCGRSISLPGGHEVANSMDRMDSEIRRARQEIERATRRMRQQFQSQLTRLRSSMHRFR